MAIKKNKVIKTLKNLIKDLEKNFPISAAYLFGSYAKGIPSQWSDIDLALVSPQFKGIRFYDYQTLIPYLRNYSNFIEIHPFKNEDFKPSNLFVREILKNGIKVK